MRERTLFNSVLFKGAFIIVLLVVSSMNIYWNWSVLLNSNQSSLIQLTIPNLYFEMGIKFVLIGVLVFLTPFIGRKFKLIERNRNISSLFLVLFFVLLSAEKISLNILVSGLLILVFCYSFLKIYNQANIQKLLFYASLVVSFLTFLSFVNAIILIAFWLGVSIIRPFNIKDLLVSLIAFALPLLYYYSGLFIWDNSLVEVSLTPNMTFDLTIFEWIVIVFVLLTSLHSISYRSKMIVHQRNQMSFMLLMLVVFVALTFIYDKQFLILTSIPASLFLCNMYFSFEKKWILDGLALFVLLLIPLLKFI